MLIYVIPFVLFERKLYLKTVLSLLLQILPFAATMEGRWDLPRQTVQS